MTQARMPARTRRLPCGLADARGVIVPSLLAIVTLGACAPAPSASPAPSGLPAPTVTVPPSPGGTSAPPASPSPAIGSAAPSPRETGPTAAACEGADVKVSHGFVEGAAGSRHTEVLLVSAIRCAMPAGPAFGIRDAGGNALVAGTSAAPGVIILFPGAVYTSDARVANWCGDEPAHPLGLELRLGAEAVPVTGGPFPDEGDVPPCTEGAVPSLTATAWVLAP